jgi:hypothetical protein
MKKTARNDVTGDWIQSKPNSDQFEKNFDLIFRKKKPSEDVSPHAYEYEESRIDIVGQNGNDGLHYTYELNKSTGEVERVEDGTTDNSQK